MSRADDDSQQIASPEAPSTAPLEGAKELAPLPDLGVIGAAAEDADAATSDASAKDGDRESHSTRDRLTSRTREARPRKKRGGLIAAIVLLVLLISIIGAAVGGLAYLRWYANDDALDFQGRWYVAGTDTPIEISADAIQLTDSVSYRYKLNTQDKTITLTIGNMTGYGSYRFSLDRTQLVIFDGRTDPNAILEADVRWMAQALYDKLMDETNDVTAGIRRNRTLLTREPNMQLTPVAPTADDASSASSTDSEGPHTVWSAEEWLNRENGEGGDSTSDSGSSGATSSSNTSSNANDVDSLFQGINDLPAGDTMEPGNTSDQTSAEGTTP